VADSNSLLFYSSNSILPDDTIPKAKYIPAQDTPLRLGTPQSKPQEEVEASVRARLEANVKAKFGDHMTYAQFMDSEKRWLVNDKSDVRKIDSVYRNRDAGLARRHLVKLVKEWDEDDDTLLKVMNAQGPYCTARRTVA
jgi:hypothetical protein